jgi:hypothetical protein
MGVREFLVSFQNPDLQYPFDALNVMGKQLAEFAVSSPPAALLAACSSTTGPPHRPDLC